MYRHDLGHTGYTTAAGPTLPNVLWNFSTRGNPVDSSPTVVDGKLYVGSENGNIYCLDAKTGQQIWVNIKIDSTIRSSPAVSNGLLYICDTNDLFYCLDCQTGKVNWTFLVGTGGSSSPAIKNGYVYVSSTSGNLYCLDASTGQEMWSFNITSLAPSIGGTDWTTPYTASGLTSPAVVDDRVYIGGTNLHCLSARSGTLIWSYPIIAASAPSVSDGKVYFTSWQGDAYCLDAGTGAKIWQKEDIARGFTRFGPAVADGRVYFGGFVYCLYAYNGEEIWHYSTGDIYADAPPIVAGQYAYFGAYDPRLRERSYTYCVKAATGEYIWKSAPYFSSSLAVVDGVLYVGGDSIIAFSDSGKPPSVSEPEPSTSSPIFTPALIVLLVAVLATSIVIALAYLASRDGTAPSARWKKHFTVPVAGTLIAIILVSSVAFLYVTSFFPTAEEPSSPEPSPASLLWQTNLAHFATSMAIADEKVFTTTMQGTYAYNAQDGQFIWNTEYQGQRGVQVYEGSVYVGSSGSVVDRLNETDGSIIRSYQAPAHSNLGWKGWPGFTVADGKVFAASDGIAV
jgi:outer membrane protein assembly factor BamB